MTPKSSTKIQSQQSHMNKINKWLPLLHFRTYLPLLLELCVKNILK